MHKTGETSLKTHKLVYLAEIAQVNLGEEQLKFLGLLDAIGPSARYPKDLKAALKGYSRKVTKDYLARTREVLECLRNELTLKP